MPFSLRTIVCLLTSGFLSTSALAQNSLDQVHVTPDAGISEFSPPGVAMAVNAPAKPIKVTVDLVLVPVTVTDPRDRIVLGLGREDFEVLEGKQPQEIRHFSREDAPVSLGVVLDYSSSMKSKIERARVFADTRAGSATSTIVRITKPALP